MLTGEVIRALVLALLVVGTQTFGAGAEEGIAPVPVVAAATPRPAATPLPTATASPTQPPAAIDAERLATGKAIYLANYCGTCHALPDAETRGIFGPTHDHIGTVAAQRVTDPSYKGSATNAAEYIHESIVTPSAYFAPGAANGRHPMPPYAHLPADELDALVYYLVHQK